MAVNPLRSETKERVFIKSGATDVADIKIHYTWTIHNFSLIPKKVGHKVKSPTFSGDTEDDYNWQLISYPHGETDKNDNWVLLKLQFVPGKRSEVDAMWKYHILNDYKKKKYTPLYTQLQKFNKGGDTSPFFFPISRNELFDTTKNLLPDDVLTIVVDIIILKSITNTVNENNSHEIKATDYHGLPNDLSNVFESPKFSDVTIITCGREIQAHKVILAARSPVFAAMFNHEMKEQQENQVDITDVDYDVLREMLRYIYTGKIPNLDKMADGLLMAANKYQLETLKDQCENALCKTITAENAASLLVLSDLHSTVRLKKEALGFICTHTKDVMKTTSYQSLHHTHPHLIDETLEALANKINVQ